MRTACCCLVALVVLAGCGGSSTPCTTCPVVSGTYSAHSPALDAKASSCKQVPYPGYDGTLYVEQQLSQLTLLTDDLSATATLYTDMSMSGKAQASVDGVSANATLNGAFSQSDSPRTLNASLFVTADLQGESCTLLVSMMATRTEQ